MSINKKADLSAYNQPVVYNMEWVRNIPFSFIKRDLDIVLATIGIIVLFPLFLIIAILIKVQDPKGPVFFRQPRIGKQAKIFNIFKFRSMVIGAEQRLKDDVELYDKYVANNYKLEPKEDPRITAIGRFLRRTSLDELPQLFNVLKGEMSLVGPRPVVSQELKEYQEKKVDFLSVKPGITGYWQVSGRSDIGYPERVDLELYYIYNKSIPLDLKILVTTVWSVILKRGAY
jgi:exopolysaccharide production protein ExoY